MNNINISNLNIKQNKSSIWKNLGYALSIVALLNINNPSEAKTIYTNNFTPEITEVLENYDIVTNVEKRTGVKLPKGYAENIRNFMINNKTLKKEIAAKFTEDFIVKEMLSDRGIKKENQSLFIYCAIGYNYNQDFYTGDDGDNNRMLEFEKTIDNIEKCQSKYKNEFISYMQQKSAENDSLTAQYRRESAENDSLTAQYRRESTENNRQSIEATYSGLNDLIRFYNYYKENPSLAKNEDIKFFQDNSQRIFDNCAKYGMDCEAFVLEKMGSVEEVKAFFRFYGRK